MKIPKVGESQLRLERSSLGGKNKLWLSEKVNSTCKGKLHTEG